MTTDRMDRADRAGREAMLIKDEFDGDSRLHMIEADPNPPKQHAPDDQMLKAERHTPDGAPADPHESRRTLWLLGSLAVIGLVVVASVLGSSGDWRAAAIGVVWLLMGYAVSWSVVWGAGLIRAKEEREIEQHIIDDEHRLHATP